jgi:hypothetical protein
MVFIRLSNMKDLSKFRLTTSVDYWIRMGLGGRAFLNLALLGISLVPEVRSILRLSMMPISSP